MADAMSQARSRVSKTQESVSHKAYKRLRTITGDRKMSRKFSYVSIVTFALVIGATQMAAADWARFTPTSVGCFEDGLCFIEVSPAAPNAITSCALRNQVRFSSATVGGPEMYKTALAALLAGRPLDINTGNLTSCLGQYPKVWYLQVR
jgi:hypothetical protein